jgi:hypothetical protein
MHHASSDVDPDPHPDPDPWDLYVFGLPDHHPDPLVTSTDPAPAPGLSLIKQK